MVIIWEVFIADCKREMRLRRMTNKGLAEVTGYTVSSINAFFADIYAAGTMQEIAETYGVDAALVAQ